MAARTVALACWRVRAFERASCGAFAAARLGTAHLLIRAT
jgi:hypothetical protein